MPNVFFQLSWSLFKNPVVFASPFMQRKSSNCLLKESCPADYVPPTMMWIIFALKGQEVISSLSDSPDIPLQHTPSRSLTPHY